jgi:putative ABC transport system ATP-binding protein
LETPPARLRPDEPTGNLDSEKSGEVMDLLRGLNDERGQTMVIVTHDDEVGRRCDRVIRVRDGRIEN